MYAVLCMQEVVTHTAPPFFTFHHLNAYEEAGSLHVDFCGYEGPQVRPEQPSQHSVYSSWAVGIDGLIS
jgi:carotenoid cleavage dioxygenase-like enzyme